ncbi:leucine-rich repeat and immunoglobulin-like domain-containing nogo receptor-interacting protein 1 isoform X1 [Gadus macrocephalus]|uniref:leucine-rich repeat and immunoglobulin-like domain-containing nogo receptor-interacting protein 1 isoform X1 n=1 Tax=Gadus macrocephalus TaxID=80720 RepID=UPI0028CB2AB1|nr:leucine-rich repeat and immunoglobulin-like domain-containing nogo receptor-interacting protein 1 isoform X1 [Gadus macrocephalus]
MLASVMLCLCCVAVALIHSFMHVICDPYSWTFSVADLLCLAIKARRQMFKTPGVQWRLGLVALYLWVFGAVHTKDTPWTCPQPCRCNSRTLEANCSDCQLGVVPDGFPQDCRLLNLTHNHLKILVSQQFKTWTQLEELDVSDNPLVTIEAEAFLGLRSLLTLRLARNRLRVIPAGAFKGLPRLKLLDIRDNQILVLLDFTFQDLPSLLRIDTGRSDLVFVSPHAFAGLTNLRELNVDRCNLTAVPTEGLRPLNGLGALSFHRLGLTTLTNYSFRWLGNLKKLVISHWSVLETLEGNSLFGLNLTFLTVSHCNLSVVPYASLHHLVYLVHLDLSFNPIRYVRGNSLRDLLRLQEFHLVGGQLLRIDPRAFHGLARFKVLNVSGNLLKTLEEGVFSSVSSLGVLRLDDNPLACDCRLLWVLRRRVHLVFDRQPPVCTTEVRFQGWSFMDFAEVDLPGPFTCRRSRIVNRKPQYVQIAEGYTVHLHCNAEGDPTPSVSWLNPQRVQLSAVGRLQVLTNGSLEVRYAQARDSGVYVCLASNAGGNDSIRVSLAVRGFSRSSRNSLLFNETQSFPFEVKTLAVAITIGVLSFFSSVTICFIFMFLWSKGKGQYKHTATIEYVPRSAASNNNNGGKGHGESSRFTMKLI